MTTALETTDINPSDIVLKTTLDQSDINDIFNIINDASEVDKIAPVSEHCILSIKHHQKNKAKKNKYYLIYKNNNIIAFAFISLENTHEANDCEIVVSPKFRRRSLGTQLLDTIRSLHIPLKIWAHGNTYTSQMFAKKNNLAGDRISLQMKRSLLTCLPTTNTIKNISIEPIDVQNNIDDLVKLNTEIFSDHPEQGLLTKQDFLHRMQETWFDPNGLFIAKQHISSTTSTLIGFAWTKIHQSPVLEDPSIQGDLGEIYVAGVKKNMRGHGVGKNLICVALEYLRSHQLVTAMLYVDQTNIPAVILYEKLDFEKWGSDIVYII